MVDLIPNNLEEIIALRLELTQQEKFVIKESIDAIDTKIKSAINHIGARPRETDVELVAMMSKLEHVHNTTPSDNAAERIFMYDMKKLQEKKKYLVEYNSMQSTLDELKVRRTALQKDLREKDASLDELYLGSRKLKLAEKIGCSAGELIETKFTVPADKLSQIIGKGGATLQKIEADCKVSLDAKEAKSGNSVDTKDLKVGSIRVTGTESSIAAAITAIFTIVSAVTEEITLADEKIVCLIVDKNAFAHEIESRCDVRIDVSRAKKLCKVSGQPEGVKLAIDEIRSVHSLRIQVPIEVTILPFVVGKGGATIKALGEGHRVAIDVEREAKLIVIAGFADDVKKVASVLLDIITENTEVEEVIKMDKNTIMGCIIGAGGAIVRSLQKELNVQIKTEKVEKGAEKVDKSELETITIRGVTSKVIVAKLHVLELLAAYKASTAQILVPDDLMALVVGKKGAKIIQFREKFPDAVIDIDAGVVKVQSASAETRQAILASIDEIVKSNYSTNVPITLDLGIAMKGTRGADIRTALGALNVQFDILPEAGHVKLRGLKENVISGLEALDVFFGNNYSIEMPCHEDDFSSIFNMGSAESSMKAIETAHRVEIRPLRKEGAVRIRGERSDVENAKEAIEGTLNGDVHLGSTVFSIDSQAFASIIGKGGATLKKFETDNDVKVDLLKSRGAVRIRGAPDTIQAAKLTLLRFLDDIKAISSVDIASLSPADSTSPSTSTDKNYQKIADLASSIFHVEISLDKNVYTFRGNLHLVEEAKAYIRGHLSGHIKHCEQIPTRMIEAVRKLDKDFDLIRVKHGVEIEVMSDVPDAKGGSIRTAPHLEVRGGIDAVSASKVLLFKLFKRVFPTEFTSISLPASCLKEMGNVFPYEVAQSCWGAMLTMDRQMACVRIMGEDIALIDAAKVVEAKLADWCEHHASVPVEEYMLPAIIGPKGAAILALQKELHVKIHLNRTAMMLELESPAGTAAEPNVLSDAVRLVSEKVASLKQHTWTTVINVASIGLFVGKQGIRINKIRSESGATIEINRATGSIELRGTESAVDAGKDLVLEILKDMPQISTVQVSIPSRAFASIIGTKGAKAQEITDLSGARFDMDRVNETATLRGTPDAVQKLKELIEEILESEGFNNPVVEEVVVAKVVDSGHWKDLGPIPGAVYDAASAAAAKAKLAELNMSKSAIRRRRRKEMDHAEAEESLNGAAKKTLSKAAPKKSNVAVKAVAVVEAKEESEEDEEEEEEDDEIYDEEEEETEKEEEESDYYTDSPIPSPSELEDITIKDKFSSSASSAKPSALDKGFESRPSTATVGIIGRSVGLPIASQASRASEVTPEVDEVMKKDETPYNHFNSPRHPAESFIKIVGTKAPVVVQPKQSAPPPKAPTQAATSPAVNGTSSNLLDMLLGHAPAAAASSAPTQPQIPAPSKHSLEIEKLIASMSAAATASLDTSVKSQTLSPRAHAESDAGGSKKSGYYKSKSGFSVRL